MALVRALITEPVASTVVVLDDRDSATLTEISRATGKPLTTIQRAMQALAAADIVVRDAPRGRWRFAAGAPRRALRELAEWHLDTGRPTGPSKPLQRRRGSGSWQSAPATIRDERIRAAWPTAIRRIVAEFRPERVILFGSQAKGDAGSDSDVDLLVIFDDDTDQRERRIGIRSILRDMPFAKDILVGSVTDLGAGKGGTAVASAIRDGVVVYER